MSEMPLGHMTGLSHDIVEPHAVFGVVDWPSCYINGAGRWWVGVLLPELCVGQGGCCFDISYSDTFGWNE